MPGAAAEHDFVAHWRSLPREGLVPTLSTFLDRPHPRFSPWVFILDVDSADTLTVRLWGTRMADTFGELTGLNFIDFLKRDLRPTISRAHSAICALPCGWLTSSRALTTAGREVVGETLSLPLMHKGEPRCGGGGTAAGDGGALWGDKAHTHNDRTITPRECSGAFTAISPDSAALKFPWP